MKNTSLISKIKSLDALTAEEKAELIALLNNTKKYGLVWEDKPEDVEELLRTQLPVFQEVPERRILAQNIQPATEKTEKPTDHQQTLFDEHQTLASTSSATGASTGSATGNTEQQTPNNKHQTTNPEQQTTNNKQKTPNHILIEGDNLHALTALTFTHEGKIDVIYIDPPYNTGNKDFKYNDRFVDREDSYRHSKWLSFMNKRLQIAKKLLSDKGVIFISIDDNEQAQLKMLCDEVFNEVCHVATLPVIMNLKGNHDNYGFSDTHEFCLVYTKIEKNCEFGVFDVDEEVLDGEWQEDEYGYFKKADTLRRTGQDASRERRPKGWFPVFIDVNDNVYATDTDEPENSSDRVLWPVNDDGTELSWTWSRKKINNDSHNLIVTQGRTGLNIYKKQRPQIGDLPTRKPKSLFYKPDYSTSTSTNELKKIFSKKVFDAPKPVPFIKDLLLISSLKDFKVLDFFAGTGTALHATMQLNAEDGGNRQCILVTNNENNIAEEVCYERNRRVIEGYTNSKGQWVEGLPNNNFRYYKTEFVGSAKTEANRRKLTRLSTALLQIKEDCYHDITAAAGFDTESCHISANGSGRYLVVIYHNRQRPALIEQLREWIKTLPETDEKIRMYAFSDEKEVLLDDFYDVAERIMAVPLPDAIYNAYRATFRNLGFDRKEPAKAENENQLPANPDEIDFNATDPQ